MPFQRHRIASGHGVAFDDERAIRKNENPRWGFSRSLKRHIPELAILIKTLP
jgi:hypothetical protein